MVTDDRPPLAHRWGCSPVAGCGSSSFVGVLTIGPVAGCLSPVGSNLCLVLVDRQLSVDGHRSPTTARRSPLAGCQPSNASRVRAHELLTVIRAPAVMLHGAGGVRSRPDHCTRAWRLAHQQLKCALPHRHCAFAIGLRALLVIVWHRLPGVADLPTNGRHRSPTAGRRTTAPGCRPPVAGHRSLGVCR